MEFSVTNGMPTPDELAALQAAMANHKREELIPGVRRSVYGLSQLRQALPHQITFGKRKNS